jgi:RHS repeat-associated protein
MKKGGKTLNRWPVIVFIAFLYSLLFSSNALANDSSLYNDTFAPKGIYDIPANTPIGKSDQEHFVSPVTGSLSIQQQDLHLLGRNGLDLNLVRKYSSNESNLVQPKVNYSESPYTYTITNYMVVAPYDGYSCSGNYCEFEGSGTDTWDYGTDREGAYAKADSIKDFDDGVYKIDYYNVHVETYNTYGTGYSPNYTNTTEPYTYTESKYNLGSGWSLNFPSIEISGNQKYLHLEDGTVYSITNDNKLDGYSLQNLKFINTYENIGGKTAIYKLSNHLGVSQYFDNLGYWIGTKDSYNNQITVSYVSKPVNGGSNYLVIDKIIDSLDRVVQFTYTNNSITISYSGKTIKYNKMSIPNETNEMVLSSVVDENGEETKYGYLFEQTSFSFLSSITAGTIKYANLTKVTYPTESKTLYNYQIATKNFGSGGTLHYYRVKESYDELNTEKKNVIEYVYDSNNFSGYPANSNPDYLPPDFIYKNSYSLISNPLATDTTRIGLKVEQTFNYKHLNTETLKMKENQLKQVTTKTYNADKLPISVMEAFYDPITNNQSSTTSSYIYDQYANILSYTNPKGHVTTYTYSFDFPGLWKTKKVVVNGMTTENIERNVSIFKPEIDWKKVYYTENGLSKNTFTDYSYDTYGNVTSVITILENNKQSKTDITYSNNAYPSNVKTYVTSVNSQGQTVTEIIEEKFNFDNQTGRLLNYLDGNAVKNGALYSSEYDYEYSYDLLGRLTEIKYPRVTGEATRAFTKATYSIDPINQQFIIEEADEEGHKTQSVYDGLSRLIYEKNQDAIGIIRTINTIHYDSLGRIEYELDAENQKTSYFYDPIGRITQTTNADGSSVIKVYDDVNQIVKTIDERGNEVSNYFDELGRSIKIEKKDIKTGKLKSSSILYEFENSPFKVRETDFRGNHTDFTYNDLNQLIKVTQRVKGIVQESSYKYNILGKQIESSVDSQKTVYEYDEIGRLSKRIDPSGKSSTYQYDHNDNVIKETDRNGIVLTQSFDERSRLIKKVKGTQQIDYSYYQDGSRKTMIDSTGTTAYQYYPDQSLKMKTYPDGKTISYEYHSTGQLSKLTEPFGVIWDYKMDNRNRMDFITLANSSTKLVDYDYHPNGLIWKATQGNGMQGIWEYDGFNNLNTLDYNNAAGTNIHSFSYTPDNNGNIINKTENGFSSFTYDELNRISTNSEGTEEYGYDKLGNRLTLKSATNSFNLNTFEYVFNEWNQLTQVKKNGTVVGEYQYNGDGLLVEKKQNGITTRYYYDGDQIIAEGKVTTTGVDFVARYLRGHSLIYREDNANKKGYYIHNGHGDVIGLRNETGSVLNTYSYDIWGTSRSNSETMPNPFRYSGELWDSETNLQYLRSRWYDPSLGRFISEDTYEGESRNPLSLNLYTYVENNPLKYVDPSGRVPVVEMGEGGSDRAYAENPIETTYQMFNAMGYKLSFDDKVIIYSYFNNLGSLLEDWAMDELGAKGKTKKKNGCNCFTAGTKVLTDEGEKNIEDIEIGDKVLAKDENNPDGKLAFKEVTALFRNQRDDIIKLNVGDQIIETTDNHPFWVEGKGWVFADELQVGDKLQKADGSNLTIDKIDFIKLDKPVTVYNFTVADYHTYFVTDIGIWVHNTNCPNGWIQRDVYQEMQKSLGKEAAKKFSDAMKKGYVNSSKKDNGIKKLSGKGEKIGNKYYQYEIKIVGKYGNARVYGNYDEKTGHIIFTKFVKSH